MPRTFEISGKPPEKNPKKILVQNEKKNQYKTWGKQCKISSSKFHIWILEQPPVFSLFRRYMQCKSSFCIASCWIVLKSFPSKFSTHFRSTMYYQASSNPVLHHDDGSCHLKLILKKNENKLHYIHISIILFFHFLIVYYKSMLFMIVVKILRQLKSKCV